jgi:hypothetical protein
MTGDYTTEQFKRDVADYTSVIEQKLRYLKLVGVAAKDRGDKDTVPELHTIFVPLRVVQHGSPLQRRGQDAQGTIIDVLERHPGVEDHHMVLLGGPGSGKSTALRHLAWSHAAAYQGKFSDALLLSSSQRPLVPVSIELHRLAESRRHHPDEAFLSSVIEVLVRRNGIEVDSRMFERLLHEQSMLLLFDGLDEIAMLSERKALVAEVEAFARYYPGNHMLVTSRPDGYELTPFSHNVFLHTEVQAFDDEQIQQFLERWHTHVLCLSSLPYFDQHEVESLSRTLKESTHLHKLAQNPLLLTVITVLHHYERLPDRRVYVYDRYAEILLETWAKLQGTRKRWQGMRMGKEDQYACVAHLGFILHQRSQEQQDTQDGANDVPASLMLKEIVRFLDQQDVLLDGAEQHEEARLFLELMQREAELIVECGTDEHGNPLYGFVHRTFQEYFAAVSTYQQYLQAEDPAIVSNFLKEHLHDPYWHEVILLLLGKLLRKPATNQLNRILQATNKGLRSRYTDLLQQDLFFVCDCLIEEIAVERDLVESVILRLSDLVNYSPFPSQRTDALQAFSSLMQTRQYAYPARKALEALITENSSTDSYSKSLAAHIVDQHNLSRPEEQRLAANRLVNAVIPPKLPQTTSADKAQEAKTILDLLPQEGTRQFLERCWHPMSSTISLQVSDIPNAVVIARQEQLSTSIRDEMYQLLSRMVPQFDQLDSLPSIAAENLSLQ